MGDKALSCQYAWLFRERVPWIMEESLPGHETEFAARISVPMELGFPLGYAPPEAAK